MQATLFTIMLILFVYNATGAKVNTIFLPFTEFALSVLLNCQTHYHTNIVSTKFKSFMTMFDLISQDLSLQLVTYIIILLGAYFLVSYISIYKSHGQEIYTM